MFFKAERTDDKKQLKGNPVKILLNNFPLKIKEDESLLSSLAEKQMQKESLKIKNIRDFYKDLSVNLRNREQPELSFKVEKISFKQTKPFGKTRELREDSEAARTWEGEFRKWSKGSIGQTPINKISLEK